ncbi:RNA polymerase sigma factor [uncultured Mucilaginibacter sp.]|uniref:RNA polymerase sigma factor n=1 Tax=uncultured Mucilaginibacter sp. TaxID=797541 RepID=UPI0025E1603E|nr:RNA polymerase sigma factor [uncultured Mucilaginibacter sp.]
MHQPRRIAEEEIISQCKTGSLKYQELLYKQFYSYAMGIGLRYCLTRDDALEVVNDAFIKVFNSINNFNSDRPFKAWLRTIIVNTSIDRRRKDLKFQLNVDIETTNPAIHASALDDLHAQDIIKMMSVLPPIQLTIFNLYEIDGYSHDEIAILLAIPVSSSRVYLSRAKEKLRSAIRTEALKHGRSVR